jgi:hypothetical protein
MKQENKKKVITIEPNPLWERIWPILLFLYIVDGMVSTPLVLYYVPGSFEANPIHSQFYSMFGLGYFFFAPILTSMLIYFCLSGMHFKLSIWRKPTWVVPIIVILLMIIESFAVINNFSIFFGGHGLI